MSNLLNTDHRQHLTESAISIDIADLNFYSWDANDENAIDSVFDLLVDNPKYRNNGTLSGGSNNTLANVIRYGGWVFEGHLGVSVKPDCPRIVDGKTIKYESVRGCQQLLTPRVSIRAAMAIAAKLGVDREFDIAQNPNSEDLGFWDWFKASGFPLIITEGCKKACALVSDGYPAIALNGVYGWGSNDRDEFGNIETDIDGNRIKTIVPELIPYLADREIVMAFDRDEKPETIKYVANAMRSFAANISDIADSVTQLKWNGSKGIDDLIVAKGVKHLDRIYKKRMEIKQIGRPSQNSDNGDIKLSSLDLAEKLAVDRYQGKIRYESKTRQYWEYGAGLWVAIEDTDLFGIVQDYLDTVDGCKYGARTIEEVIKLARRKVSITKWNEPDDNKLIPFINGVYDIQTRSLLPHSESFGFKWQMPRRYSDAIGDWSSIDRFLREFSSQNNDLKNILLAFCNVALLGSPDLQKFLYLSGSGRNGKGTFIRLLELLVGDENRYSTSIASLCDNRFTAANIRNKRLVTCPEENKRPDDIGIFKSATGMDNIEAEIKGKQSVNFTYQGIFVVSANKPTFHGDNNVAIKERKVDFPCLYTCPEELRRDLRPIFNEQISAFTTYVLSIDPEWAKNIIKKAGSIGLVKKLADEMAFRENNIEDYFDKRLVFDPTSSIQSSVLYKNYREFCDENGGNPKSQPNFTPLLFELCNDTMGMGITKTRTKMNTSITGIRFATILDEYLDPTIGVEVLKDAIEGVEVEPIQGKDSADVLKAYPKNHELYNKIYPNKKDGDLIKNAKGVMDKNPSPPTPETLEDIQGKGSSEVLKEASINTPTPIEPGQRVYIPARAIHGYYERLEPIEGRKKPKARVILEDGKKTEVWILPECLQLPKSQ